MTHVEAHTSPFLSPGPSSPSPPYPWLACHCVVAEKMRSRGRREGGDTKIKFPYLDLDAAFFLAASAASCCLWPLVLPIVMKER